MKLQIASFYSVFLLYIPNLLSLGEFVHRLQSILHKVNCEKANGKCQIWILPWTPMHINGVLLPPSLFCGRAFSIFSLESWKQGYLLQRVGERPEKRGEGIRGTAVSEAPGQWKRTMSAFRCWWRALCGRTRSSVGPLSRWRYTLFVITNVACAHGWVGASVWQGEVFGKHKAELGESGGSEQGHSSWIAKCFALPTEDSRFSPSPARAHTRSPPTVGPARLPCPQSACRTEM